MEIDFDKMEVGEKVALPPGKWSETQRAYYDQANEFARLNHGVQFEVSGHEGSNFEQGQYWIMRTK